MLDSIINLYYKICYWFDRRNLDLKYWENEQPTNTGLYGHSSSQFTHEEYKNLVKGFNKIPPWPKPPPRIITEGKLPVAPAYIPEEPTTGPDHLQILEMICSELEEYISCHQLSKNIRPPKIKVYTHVEENTRNSTLLYSVIIKATPVNLLRLEMTFAAEDKTCKPADLWNILYQKIIADIYDMGFEALTLRYYELIKGHRIIPLVSGPDLITIP